MKTALLKLLRSRNPEEEKFRRRIYIFLVCLSISSVFWLLISLNKTYTSTVVFPVQYTGIPSNKVVVNKLPESLVMEITAQGFDLFAYRFRVRREPITINVKSGLQYSTLNNNSNPVIPTRSLLAHIIRQLGSDIRLVSVTPDKINLSLSDKKTKTVKVTARLALDFDKQFGLTDSIQINPNRVEVSGPAAAVEKIRGAITEKAVMKSLDKTTSKTLRLVSANGSNLTFTPAEVTVTIPVERFTEGSAEVAIETINVPLNGAVKLIPKKATVTYQVALSKYDNVSPSMFILTADLSRRQGSRVTLEIKKHPSFVKSVKVQPEKADIIITK